MDDEIEVLREDGLIVIKDLASGRIVETRYNPTAQLDWKIVKPQTKLGIFCLYVVALFSGLCIALFFGIHNAFSVSKSDFSGTTVVILIAYASVQIATHEYAHVAAFRHFGRKPNKVGFKLNYGVFPAVFIRMNDTHLLTRPDRFIVHTAGIFVNSVLGIISLVVAHFANIPELQVATSWYIVAMAYNCVPILGSDGYRAMLVIMGIREKKALAKNPGCIIFAVCASYVVAAVFALRIVYTCIEIIVG